MWCVAPPDPWSVDRTDRRRAAGAWAAVAASPHRLPRAVRRDERARARRRPRRDAAERLATPRDPSPGWSRRASAEGRQAWYKLLYDCDAFGLVEDIALRTLQPTVGASRDAIGPTRAGGRRKNWSISTSPLSDSRSRATIAAQNHVRSDNLVLCITVPAVIEVWRPHAVQIHRCRRVSPPPSREPQHGQTNPSGQRDANRYSRHASSVPKRCWNSKIVNGKSGRATPRTYDTTRMELTRYPLLI